MMSFTFAADHDVAIDAVTCCRLGQELGNDKQSVLLASLEILVGIDRKKGNDA